MSQSSTARDAGLLAFGQLLAHLAEAIAPLLIVRLVSKHEVGLLTEVLLYHTMVVMILTSGLPATLSYHLPGRSLEERAAVSRRLARILFALGLGAGALQLVVGLVSRALDGPASLQALALLCLFPVGDVPSRMLPNLLVVEQRARVAAVISVIRALAMVACTVLPLLAGGGVREVVMCMSSLGVAYALGTALVVRAVYQRVAAAPSPLTVGELIRFAIPMGLTELVVNLKDRLDKLLIALLFAEAVYAEYQAGSWQVPIIPSIAYAIGVAYTPGFTAHFKAGDKHEVVQALRAQITKTSLIVIPIATVFVISAEETMGLLFGHDYLGGANVFRCYSLMMLTRVTSFGSVLVAAGRPRLLLRAAAVTFGLMLATSIPLVLTVGFIGPAIAAVVAVVPSIVTYMIFIGGVTDTRRVFPLAAYARVLALALVAAAPAVALKLTVAGPVGAMFAAEAAVFLGSYAVLGTLTGLIERADWRYLRDWALVRSKPGASGGDA